MLQGFRSALVQEVIELESIDSTNSYALAEGRPGLLVLAREQTSGRGRMNRAWYSPRGTNIYMTLTVNETDPRYSILTGVAVQEALSGLVRHPTIEIKWPNDLIAEGRKLGGILCEARHGITALGIGINVNQTSWPEDIHDRAVSLAEILGEDVNQGSVVVRVLESMESWFVRFRAEGFASVREAFLTNGLLKGYRLVSEDGSPCTIEDLTMDGHLVIAVSGQSRTLISETITISA